MRRFWLGIVALAATLFSGPVAVADEVWGIKCTVNGQEREPVMGEQAKFEMIGPLPEHWMLVSSVWHHEFWNPECTAEDFEWTGTAGYTWPVHVDVAQLPGTINHLVTVTCEDWTNFPDIVETGGHAQGFFGFNPVTHASIIDGLGVSRSRYAPCPVKFQVWGGSITMGTYGTWYSLRWKTTDNFDYYWQQDGNGNWFYFPMSAPDTEWQGAA